MSDRDVFVTHFWERPTFLLDQLTPTDDDTFWANSYDVLQDGSAADGIVGLTSLTGPGQILHGDYSPTIFIVTPCTTEAQRRE